jgi:hypothetical protein
LDESGAEDIGYGLRGRAIYKADTKRLMQVPLIENEEIDKLIKPFIQEELVYGDNGTEESRTGLRDPQQPGVTRHGDTLPTSENPQLREQPQRDADTEEFGDVYQPFQGRGEHLLSE